MRSAFPQAVFSRCHFPEAWGADVLALAVLEAVAQRQAQAALIADWMSVGFIHGVKNTDNMAISGETIDYGPCAFMDHYDAIPARTVVQFHAATSELSPSKALFACI